MVNWFDVLLVLVLVGSIAMGFHQGLLRQAFLLLAIYIGTVLSAQYYGHLASLFLQIFPAASTDIADMIAFIVLLVAFTMVVSWLIFAGFKETKLPNVAMVDNVGGSLLGGVFGLFAIAMTLMIGQYALQVPWPEGSSVRFALSNGLNGSVLSGMFGLPVPVFQSVLNPWMPSNVPFVF
jgi:uncharacterized membrane protein required for colicin V production